MVERVSRIEGWLLIPMFGLLVSPLVALVSLMWKFEAEANQKESLSAYGLSELAWTQEEVLSEVLAGLLTFYGLIVLVSFLRRSNKTPRRMIIRYVLYIALAFIDAIFIFNRSSIENDFFEREFALFALIFAGSWNGLWILYFLKSSRVKQTFGQSPDVFDQLAEEF